MIPADPYEPPVTDTTSALHKRSDVERLNRFAPIAFIILPLVFGAAGFAGYIALAIALEVQPTEKKPVLSHGQQAFLFSLPICTLIAASVGVALALLSVRQRLLSAIILAVVAIAGWSLTRSLWNAQIAQYGRDPSEAVLYYPPAGYATGAAVLAALIFCATMRRRTNPAIQ